MIEQQQYRYIPTELELNGPVLSFVQNPVGSQVSHGDSASFTGLATATFPTQDPINPALNSGTIAYQWYEVGVGPLSDSSIITGTATRTLNITNVTSPTDNSRQFYLRADYIPAGDTGNANNEPLDSTPVELKVLPFITITTQPSDTVVGADAFATISVNANLSDNSYGNLSYQWQINGENLIDSASVTGSTTNTLRILRSTIGTFALRVLISNDSASTVTSNEATLTVVEPRPLVNFETIGTTSTAELSTVSLESGEYVITSANHDSDTIVFHSTETDIDIEFEMYGAKGSNSGSYVGGEGGFSRIRFTLIKDEEYVLKGIKSSSALFLYRKSSLIAVVGQGGNAGNSGNGGRGGGINIAGENGFGRFAGTGGTLLPVGSLTINGIFGSSSTATTIYPEDSKATGTNGGRTISCTKGVYWRDQGISACSDVGSTQFRLSDGTIVSNTRQIQRGYKKGYSLNQTAGAAANVGGRGGNGAIGGNGGSEGGGGGGSGYTDGSVTVLANTLGGNASSSKVVMRIVGSGIDFDVSPAINGVTEWSIAERGPLILDGESGTTYTVTPRSTKNYNVKLWGQGRSTARGGYTIGTVSLTGGQSYTVKLNTGAGSGGSSSGWPGKENGGGYAGLFTGTSITQGNALLIAGGAGGQGTGHSTVSGGNGGASSGGNGSNSPNSQIGSTGGGGGTQSSGGGGGGGGGSSGGALQGGSGGSGRTSGCSNAGGGGGGGGGYFGGGGGGGGNDFCGTTRASSGGGGGSGFVKSGINGSTTTFTDAPNRGNAGDINQNSRVVFEAFLL